MVMACVVLFLKRQVDLLLKRKVDWKTDKHKRLTVKLVLLAPPPLFFCLFGSAFPRPSPFTYHTGKFACVSVRAA